MADCKRFGLALGGGGARGYAHIGVMRILEREGFRPSAIAGTSMGSLMGAMFASGHTADEVQELLSQTSFWRFLDWNPLSDMLNYSELVRFLEPHIPRQMEEFPIPFGITATDLITGTEVYFRQGDVFQAIRASIAYPGAINPIWVGHQLLADGGILNQIPVDLVRFLGSERVIAVDVTPLEVLREQPHKKSWWEQIFRRGIDANPIQNVYRAIEIMQIRLAEVKLAVSRPDLVLRPKLEGIGLFSFQQLEQAIQDGEAAALGRLEEIRELLAIEA
ncbi:patatin-like phospholipase family protein [Meiothermus sp. CFH 77666]|uniref:patatin-like phospholipase family protein n=1 Tax=Meiothermus sp. CFH 77666 TaxID=2817942 RepID=UPI001AA0AC03|nr:patatin-like phospholipase family protein [Meiothermus sp. CFH 77666]MBO1436053.1 patatin-like phospholipase family protein [Meiothermus sp. CFH 77666]